jgi:hypothetical protein
MVFSKPSTAEVIEKTNSVTTSRSFHLSISERKVDESTTQDIASTVVSKLLPIQTDNMSLNLAARYDLSPLNRSQTMVRNLYRLKNEFFYLISLESIKCEKIFQVKFYVLFFHCKWTIIMGNLN